MAWEQWVSIAALVAATIAVIVGVLVLRRISSRASAARPLEGEESADRAGGPPAFVVNPTKVSSLEAFRDLGARTAAEAGLGEPLWFTTTPESSGSEQASEAVRAGASVVIAVGGDGTVREVAAGLSRSGVPMGLIPMGTGNLFARNLDLPVNGLEQLMLTALTGADHRIDLGWVRPELARAPTDGVPSDDPLTDGVPSDDAPAAERGGSTARDGGNRPHPGDEAFLVMSGVGFDAAMVAGADDELKSRLGWLAYFLVGARHLHGRKVQIGVQIGSGPVHNRKLRSLLVANVGKLPGGFVLFPDAAPDDGRLDVAALDTRGGLFGWASLFGTVIMQGIGIRSTRPTIASNIEFWRGSRVAVRLEEPEPLQVDGDLVGRVTGAEFWLEEGALVVRTRRTSAAG
ncbi:diacylglycerol kinase [Pseudactinotalea sp. HY160]|uniref:diacylglycerol/lipid kinase family protein n=1 Tax=Pseudactinotalea sp. HY160 TaxID=2654490 RepID=UPI00128E7F04|nr:diacylglycerol kinase family protein [Pseudactinotalea sp. HY160]MPV49047.1 diacylglycerol kinase [Pseudactinotalea sp. HY160]